MKLKTQNPHLSLTAMMAMTKAQLAKLITRPVSMNYHKETLIDILNEELNHIIKEPYETVH